MEIQNEHDRVAAVIPQKGKFCQFVFGFVSCLIPIIFVARFLLKLITTV